MAKSKKTTEPAAEKPLPDIFTRQWIIANSIEIVKRYSNGVLTLRALHYQLVGIGMTNSVQHYKRVVAAMIEARWDYLIDFEKFSDHEREVMGETLFAPTNVYAATEEAKNAIRGWMTYYSKNRWENQRYAPEVWIEKKALQGVFQDPCNRMNVALAPCKGYPSLTFLNDAIKRFREYEEKDRIPVVLYFGDYDASGEDIPRSIQENFRRFGMEVDVRPIALTEEQVIELKLPPAPTKSTDSRAAKWEGLGQVELDAVEFRLLQRMCSDAIAELFDEDLYSELLAEEADETKIYRADLKNFVITDLNDEDGEN